MGKSGYRCSCGRERIVEIKDKEDSVKNKTSCIQCRKIRRLKSKANNRGEKKSYYL